MPPDPTTLRPITQLSSLNLDELGSQLQDLKQANPRLWQVITSLRTLPMPQAFYAEIILPGAQVAGQDVLDNPVILRLPQDMYNVWNYNSVLLQDVSIACKVMPTTQDYIVDILITRDLRKHWTSIFKSTSKLPRIQVNGNFWTVIDNSDLSTTELLDGDEFRIDVIQADASVANVGLLIRGNANIQRNRPTTGIPDPTTNVPTVHGRFRSLQHTR